MDETELTRLFAETPSIDEGEEFVRRVSTKIAWHRRTAWLVPMVAIGFLLVAIWASWPAALAFSTAAISGIVLVANGVNAFFSSSAGLLLAAVLSLTGVLWQWLHYHLREAGA
jgi:hypothetical protein